MSVIIKVDTGFVGAVHEEDTQMSIKEWNALSDEDKRQWMNDCLHENIGVYAVDEETGEEITGG